MSNFLCIFYFFKKNVWFLFVYVNQNLIKFKISLDILYMLRKKVLIIDDSIESANALTECINELQSFEVKCCDNGSDGIKTTKEWMPDVIFIDYLMTPFDGITVMKILKDNPITCNIFICMVSANDIKNACNGCSFIRKPFNKSSIFQILKEFNSMQKL